MQPAADDRLGEPRAVLARGGGGEVAQPGEALQLLGQRAVAPIAREIEVARARRLAADGESAGEQGIAALAVALDMVARHRDQLQRLAASACSRERSEPRASLRDDRRARPPSRLALIRSPLKRLMLAA